AAALRQHVDRYGVTEPDAPVFAGPHGGTLWAGAWRSRFWTPAIRVAGVSPLRVHDLRHTAVALWIAAGANPKQIAAWAGHTSVAVVLDATATSSRATSRPCCCVSMRSPPISPYQRVPAPTALPRPLRVAPSRGFSAVFDIQPILARWVATV
ncbi:MAG: hypothetical protein ACR2MB_00810, partial [Acidimicrobiales bacterium]